MFSLAFLCGACGILFLPALLPLIVLLVSVCLSLSLWILFKHRVLWYLLGFILGLCWVSLFAQIHLNHRLPQSWEGKTLTLTGKIVSLPEISKLATRFLFKTKTGLIRLNWYDSHLQLKASEKWRLTVRLKRPHGFTNPGGFDEEAYAFEKNIIATGYVVNKVKNQLLAPASFSINYLRQILQQRIVSKLQGQPSWELLPALMVGDRQFVTSDQWQTLRKTGTNHLIAIAGLHIGLIAGLIFFCVSFLWRRVPYLTLRIPAQIAGAFCSLMAAIFYSGLAGFPLQTERALIMLSVILLGVLFRRRVGLGVGLSLAIFLILIFNPLNVMTMSFWMSFGAVAIILYGLDGRSGRRKLGWRLIKIQWIIAIGLLPLTLWFFNQISLVAPFANMIAVPWFGLIIMPLCFLSAILLMGCPGLAQPILWLLLKNLQGLWFVLQKFSSLPVANIYTAIPSHVALFLMVIGLVLLLAPRGFRARVLSLFLFLPVIFPRYPPLSNAQFTLLDVGQGLSAIVRTKHHVLIYDTGARFSPDFDIGSAVIVPYLRHKGIRHVDVLMISHGDNDHIGGAQSILQNVPVQKILTSVPGRFVKAEKCYAGQYWQWDSVYFDVLSPPKNEPYQDNNSSCVLRVTVGKQSILLPGDIEKHRESWLLSKLSPLSILIAPHHGSRTSSSVKFVEKVNPKYILFPVGYRNRFRFPSVVVQRRYRESGAHQLNVSKTGAITFDLNGRSQNLQPELYRQTHHHIWSL